jgi:hypothetical protein
VKWVERIKQVWLRHSAGDHPLTESERAPRADSASERNAQAWLGVFGQTVHDPAVEDDRP